MAVLLGAACLAVSAPACGGGGSKGISKADYLARAKLVCQKGNRQLKSASDDVVAKLAPGQKMTEAQIDDFVRKTVIPTIRDQIKQLRAIPPPKGEKAHVEEIYKATAAASDLKRLPTEDEVASAILFMASDLSSGITGQTLDVNCGEYHN